MFCVDITEDATLALSGSGDKASVVHSFYHESHGILMPMYTSDNPHVGRREGLLYPSVKG